MGQREGDATRLGLLGLLSIGVSVLLGGAYVTYLRHTPFPPDGARLVPAFWLLGASIGLVLALRALWRGARGRRWLAALLGAGGAILAVPSVALAAIYLFAALMGD